MKPIIKWTGGKRRELPIIKAYMPSFKRYFEPFLGGGACFFGINAKEAHLNDVSTDLISFYQCVKDRDTDFFSELDKVGEQQKENPKLMSSIYYNARDTFNHRNGESKGERASLFFILREYGYSGLIRFNSKGEFNVPYGQAYTKKFITKKTDVIKSDDMQGKLQGCKFYNEDFEAFLGRFTFSEEDFIFLDPPYLTTFSDYDMSPFGIEDHERLADYLKQTKAKFMTVIKSTPEIDDMYSGFNVRKYDFSYLINIRNRVSSKPQHLLVTNY